MCTYRRVFASLDVQVDNYKNGKEESKYESIQFKHQISWVPSCMILKVKLASISPICSMHFLNLNK